MKTLLDYAEPARFKTIESFNPDFQNLQDQLSEPAWYQDICQDLEVWELIRTCPVSEEVRLECERDMFEAQRRGWSIR